MLMNRNVNAEKKGGLCFLETSADVMVQGIAEKVTEAQISV